MTDTPIVMATQTATAPAPQLAAGIVAGARRIGGSGAPRATPNTCLDICLAALQPMPSEPPCTGADASLGSGGTDAGGQFVDGNGVPGILLDAPLASGACLYAYDACADEISTLACARQTSAVPALAPAGLGLGAALLSLLGWLGIGRRSGRDVHGPV